MKTYTATSEESFLDDLITAIEEQAGCKVFTMKIVDKSEEEIEAFVVFEDKRVMLSLITITMDKGQIAVRMRGNFL